MADRSLTRCGSFVRLSRVLLTSLLLLLGLPAAPVRAASLPPGFGETQITNLLASPTAMALAPDGRLFVAEKSGALRVIKNDALLTPPFVSLSVDDGGERGLLGVAIDPAFASNGYLYLYYTTTTPTTHNRVSRFTANGDVAMPNSEVVLLDLDDLSSASNHNGGAIHFGADGKLYIAVGENANGSYSQTLANLLGKILRINADGSIPSDNPFYTTAIGRNRAIWHLGLRNPFTFAVQPGTGRFFINDVGAGTWEEIDDGGVTGSGGGLNFGWPTREGNCANSSTTNCGPPPAGMTNPVYAYLNDSATCAITGGAFYNPATAAFPADYVGDYFFGDLCGDWIKRFDPISNEVTDFATGVNGPVDLVVAPDGSLYYLAINAGSLTRVRYASNATLPRDWYFAEGYTGTGFDEYLTILNPNATAASVTITYYLTDGTTVDRALSVPATTRATVAVHETTNGVGRDQTVSARVSTTHPGGIVVERPIYFRYTFADGQVATGGQTVVGATAPRTTWSFAEGYTGPGFDTYLTILNPNATSAAITITYYLAGGSPVNRALTVGARTRATVAVHDPTEGVGRDQAVAARVTTTNSGGIVVERPIYFRYGLAGGGIVDGGHNTLGATAPQTAWYFAEGYTGAGFDEFLTILNPNTGNAAVTITYFPASGGAVTRTLTVAGSRRATVAVHDPTLGVGRDQAVAARVTTTNGGGIVVERPIYFRYTLSAGAGGTVVDGGHIALGAAAPRLAWYLPEGYTGAGFDEYLTILNPNATAAGLAITYYLANGTTVDRAVTAPANARTTVPVHDPTVGVGRDQAVAARVVTTNGGGVVVERPIYFTYNGLTGGHNVLGYAP